MDLILSFLSGVIIGILAGIDCSKRFHQRMAALMLKSLENHGVIDAAKFKEWTKKLEDGGDL